MRHPALIATLACALALTGCGGAPDTPGAKAAHDRHEKFEALGKHFKAIGDELKKESGNLEVIRTHATAINSVGPEVKGWFPAGSGPQDGVKTDALALVWQQPAEFEAATAKFADAAASMQAAAQGADIAAVRGAAATLGAACKGCHDRFREKD